MKFASVSAVAVALASNAEGVFLSLLGNPTSRSSRELRYGRRGSMSCSIAGRDCGRWRCYEDGTYGDLLDLIRRERGIDLPGALAIAIGEYLHSRCLPVPPAKPYRASSKPAADREDESKATYWRGIWRDAVDIIGTAGDRYYCEVRGIDVRGFSLCHCIKWHPGISAIVALMRDPVTSEPVGLHRTFLDPSAAKIDRRMIGRQGVVELTPRDDVGHGLGLSEGVEDGLAVLANGWRPVWAATSARAMARFPVLEAIDALTVFGDADRAGNTAASECAGRWIEHGREAAIVLPPQREVSL
jgi:hypothetical protein